MESNFDFVVVGAGINGSWAGYHLAKLDKKVLVIEQFPLPHSRGSSHGQSRGIRKAYPEQFQTVMMDDAYKQWHQLEDDTHTKLIKTTGLLSMGDDTSNFVDEVVGSFKQTPNSEFEELSPDELKLRYSCLNMGDKVRGCYDPQAGLIMADKALKVLWDISQKSGVTLVDNHPVVEIVPSSESVRVVCLKDGKERVAFVAKGIVLCAGPWTNKLTEPLGWKLPLRPIRLPVFYFRAHDFIPHNFMFKCYEDFWGLCEYEYPGLVKICRHDGVDVDPDRRDAVDAKRDAEILKTFIAKCFPGVEPEPSIIETCIYTMSPDGVHIMDTHPDYPNVVVGCGFSGTGFKMGPVTGEVLARLVAGESQLYDLTPFRADRFN